MRNVLADLALGGSRLGLTLRPGRTYMTRWLQHARITAIGKYWICKRAPEPLRSS